MPRVSFRWLAITVAASVLALAGPFSGNSAASSFTLPQVSYVTATVPASLIGPATHLACSVRTEELAPPFFESRLICYDAAKPASPPPPPPPPYFSPVHQVLVGAWNDQNGHVTFVVLNCTEFAGGAVAIQAAITFDLNKDGVTKAPGTVDVVTDTSNPLNCAETPVSGAASLDPQPMSNDLDLDGCSDWEELGPGEFSGGLRDPFNFWDFYDVWTHPINQPTVWVRDKVINLPGDIFGVVARFGPGPVLPDDQALIAALTPPTSDTGYHAAFDRSPVIGPNRWNRRTGDGAINIPDDILGVADQFGHSCLAAP